MDKKAYSPEEMKKYVSYPITDLLSPKTNTAGIDKNGKYTKIPIVRTFEEVFPVLWTQRIIQAAEKEGAPIPYITFNQVGPNESKFELQFYPTEKITGSDLGVKLFEDQMTRQIPGARGTTVFPSNSMIVVQGVYDGKLSELVSCLLREEYEHDTSYEINLRGKPKMFEEKIRFDNV